MQLGFMSAIVPDLSLQEVFALGKTIGYTCVEVMCWPPGKADRRYAGVTHIDVTNFEKDDAARVQGLAQASGIEISGLGYYPNPLSPHEEESKVAQSHLKRVIRAASLLGVGVVGTFVGRDWTRSVEENWPRFLAVWRDMMAYADDLGIRIAIENCPMLFTADEWPGGKNLAKSPAIWRRMFEEIGSANLGLTYDPSHMVWQQMDYLAPIQEFSSRIFRVHLKDVTVEREKLNQVGILAYPLEFHTPKLPGRGDVDWGAFLSALRNAGYDGPACVEVEERAFEGDLAHRKEALAVSYGYLWPLF
ncbi:MAG TPA: sugar phosphate isomerase/epimerase [Acidobacteriaceae bacterium]|nr:sugar phosphate isomerase/epimerase [Acidobacteriaceae bacterium]